MLGQGHDLRNKKKNYLPKKFEKNYKITINNEIEIAMFIAPCNQKVSIKKCLFLYL